MENNSTPGGDLRDRYRGSSTATSVNTSPVSAYSASTPAVIAPSETLEVDTTGPLPASTSGYSGDFNTVAKGAHSPVTLLRFDKRALLFAGIALALIVGIGLVTLVLASFKSHGSSQLASTQSGQTGNYDAKGLDVSNISAPDQLAAVSMADSVTINGQLQVGNTFVLTPTATPTTPKTGQIYFDKDTNAAYIYDGSGFTALGGGVRSLAGATGTIGLGKGLSITNNQLTLDNSIAQSIQNLQQVPSAFVTSLQGKTGDVTFKSGTGIAVNGTVITNTGVIGIQADSSSAVSVTHSGGTYTLRTANDLVRGTGTTGTLALFSADSGVSDSILAQTGSTISLNGDLQVSGGISYNGTGGELDISAGSNQLVFTSGGKTFQFPSSITGVNQTICVVGMDCSSGSGGSYVILGPSGAQPYTGDASAIFIDDTGTGNLLQIQSNELDRLVVTNSGDVNVAGNITTGGTVNGATISGGNISGGTVNGAYISGGSLSGGSLSDTSVNGLGVSGSAVTATGALGITTGTDQNLSLNTSGVGVIMIGSSALQGTGALNITAGGTDQNLSLSGSGAGNVVVRSPVFVGVNGALYSFDAADANGTTATICTTAGNCSGASGSGVTSTGGTGYIPVFGTDGYHLDNAILSQDAGATTLTAHGALQTLGDITVGGNASVVGTLTADLYTGDGSGLTNVNAATLGGQAGSFYTNASNIGSGTLADGRLSNNVTLMGNAFNGASQLVKLDTNGYLPVLNGSAVTNLNGSAISSGTVSNSYLTGNGAITITASTGLTGGGSVALGGTATVGLANSGVTAGTYGSASSVAAFVVNGQGQITSATTTTIALDGSQVTSGTLGDSRLSSNVAKYGDTTANFTGDLQQNGNAVCTTAGNCVGSGSGGALGGSGTAGQIAIFTGSGYTLGNSLLGQSASTITDSGNLVVQGAGGLTLGVASTTNGQLSFKNSNGTHTVSLQAPTTDPGSDLVFKLPNSYGSNGSCLQSDGAGGLIFTSCTGGAGGGVTSLDAQTGVLLLANSTAAGGTVTIDDAKADGTTKGIATFSSSQFSAVGGVVSVKAGGITATELADGTVTGTKIAGNTVTNGNLVNSSVTVAAGTNLSGGGNVALGGTITLNVASSPVFSGTLTAQGASVTVGGSAQIGSLVLNSGNGAGKTATIQTVGTLGQATTYLLPDTGGSTTTICTNSGNCIGAPGGAIASTGSTNYVPVFGSDGYHLNNSIISQDSGATLLNINGSVSSTGALTTTGTINGATISGGTISGGSLGSGQVNGLGVSSTGISASGALSVTAAANQNVTITATGTGNVIIQTPQFKNGNGATYSFNSADTSAVNAQICTSTGNCVGSGGGGVSSAGTSNYVALFGADGYHLGNSVITQSSGAVSVGGQLTATSTVTLSGLTTAGVVHNSAAGVLSTSLITSADMQGGTYTTITGTGALQAGSITTGFGTIATGNSISGTTLNASTAIQTNGTNRLDSTGALVNITSYTQTAGNMTIGSGNFTQSGSGTFTTGTGAVTLNGATTVNNTLTVTNTTTLQGNVTLSGSQLTNSGSTLNTAASLGNFASGGSIGSAASTVDTHTSIAIAQTTAGQTLTLPSPTTTTAGRILYVLNTGSAAFTMGGVNVPSGYGQVFIWNGSAWILGANGGGSTVSLQGAYDGGNSLNTTDARDITFGLADTTTDANFKINIATSSTGQFKVQKNGTDVLTVGNAGQLALSVQGSAGGIAIGGDTQLYRSGTNQLEMTNSLLLRNNTDTTTALNIQNAAGTSVVTVDTSNKALNVGAAISYNMYSYGSGSGFVDTGTTYASGGNFVQFVKVNNDANLDLVTFNGSQGFSVYLGNGDGTFSTTALTSNNSSCSSGSYVYDIRFADFNGDGNTDAATICGYNNHVMSIYPGNGDGTFGTPVNFTTPFTSYAPRGMTMGDFNGDGKMDVVVVNGNYTSGTNRNQLVVFTNTSSAGVTNFSSTIYTASAASNIFSVVSVDVNKDGHPDLVASYDSGLIVMLNNGDGTFATPVTIGGPTNPLSLVATDFNGDGVTDVAVGTSAGISVYLGNGTTGFQPYVSYAGSATTHLAITDFNNDGYPDMVGDSYAFPGDGYAVYWYNNGDGTFTKSSSQSDSGFGAALDVAAGDLNGDGNGDVAYTRDNASGSIHVLLSGASLTTTPITSTTSITASSASKAALAVRAASGQTADVMSIQSATGAAYLTVASNGNIGIGNVTSLASRPYTVTIAGSINAAAIYQQGNAVCTLLNNCGYIQNSNVAQNANINLSGQGTFGTSLTVHTNTNISTAFRVQDASGTNVLAVDTTTKSVSVGAPLTYNSLNYTSGFGFAPYVAYGVSGSTPTNTITADFNNDGIADVATNMFTAGSISVRLGNGDGTFGALKSFSTSTSSNTASMYAARVNGDANLDLVYAVSSTVYIALGNGDGTFQTPTSITSMNSGYGAAVGDINNDGKVDIVTFSGSATTGKVALGNGDGTFQTATTYTLSTAAYSGTLGDLNGDGKLDIITPNSVALGNGDGTFQSAMARTAAATNGIVQNQIATADLNADGKLDVVNAYGNSTTNLITVTLGNGDGTFQAATYYTSAALGGSTTAYSVTLADVNGDGKLDMVVGTNNAYVVVLLGNGNGTFQNGTTYAMGTSGRSYGTAAADLNGDGKVDILATDGTNNTVDVYLNGTIVTGTTVNAAISAQSTNTTNSAMTLAGTSGQTVDIFHVQDSAANMYFGISQSGKVGIGSWVNSTLDSSTYLLNVAGGIQANAASGYSGNLINLQVNGTSKFKVDQSGNTTAAGTLAIAGPTRTFTMLSYAGGSGFSTAVGYSTSAAPYDVQAADFNRDGKRDVVTANSTAGTVSVFLGNGDGTLGTKTDYTVGTDPVRVRVADVNKDGKMDIVVANRAGSSISVILGNGDGTFQTAVNYTTAHFPSAINVADINGDGKLDIVTVGYAGGASTVYVTKLLGNGDGTFQTETAIQTLTDSATYSGVYGYMNIADFNGDGNLDLSFGQSSDSVAGYQWMALGNGNGTFQTPTKINASTYSAHGAVATDLNGDGKLDIAFGSGTAVNIFLGNGDGTFQTPTTYTAQAGLSSTYAADFNGDGITDLATGSNSVGQIQVALGNGNGTFQTPTSYSLGGVSFGLIGADLTGDGKPELLAVNRNATGMVYVLINGGPVTSTSVGGTTSITTVSGSTAGLVLQGSSSQTADLLRVQDAAANALFNVAGNGKVGVGNFANLSNSAYLFNVAGNIQANTVNGFIGNLLNLQVDGVSKLRVDQAGNTTVAGILTVTDGSGNSVTLSSTGLTLSGTARNLKVIRLAAEYENAVLDPGTASNNTGTMTSGYDMTSRMNYYKWTTTQTTNQSYDIVIQVPIPTGFSAWSSSPLTITSKTSDTTNGTVQVAVIDSAGTTICNFVNITPGSSGVWAAVPASTCLNSGTYTPGDYITLRIRLQAPQNGTTQVGNITLSYLSKN